MPHYYQSHHHQDREGLRATSLIRMKGNKRYFCSSELLSPQWGPHKCHHIASTSTSWGEGMLCENSAMKLEHWSIQHLHRELLSNATTVVEAFESKNGSVLKIENDDNEDNDDYRTMLTTKTMMTTGTMKTIMTMRTMRAIREGTRTISSVFSCPQQLNRWPCHSLTH